MTRTVKTTTKRHPLKQIMLQGGVWAVLAFIPSLALAEDETDSAFVSTADLELSDSAGTELNVPRAQPAQPVSGLKPSADPTPAQSLIEASLAAAGVRPGSESEVLPATAPSAEPDSAFEPEPLPKPVSLPKARPAIVPPKPPVAAAPTPPKTVAPAAKVMPAPTHFVPQEASATRVLEAGDYVQVRLTTKATTPDLETVVPLDAAGQVTLPYLGKVKLGGLFLPIAAETLTLRYADGFYVNPRVSVLLMQPAPSSDPVSKGTAP